MHGDGDALRAVRQVAAHHFEPAVLRCALDAVGELRRPIVAQGRRNEGNRGPARRSAHGSEVGGGYGHAAVADRIGAGVYRIVAGRYQRIGAHHQLVLLRHCQHGGVVARAYNHTGVCRRLAEPGDDAVDEGELAAHSASISCARVSRATRSSTPFT